MKLFLVILAFLGLINSLSFDENRQKLLNTIFKFYEETYTPVDESVKRYFKSQSFDSYVFAKILHQDDLSNFGTSKFIYNQLKYIKFSTEPNVAHKIEVNEGTQALGFHYYGAIMHDGKKLYYVVFKLRVINEFTFKFNDSITTQCTTTVEGVKECNKVITKVPIGITTDTYDKIKEYINHECIKEIKNHIQQINELNGKILYTFNEGEPENCEVVTASGPNAYIIYDENKVKLFVFKGTSHIGLSAKDKIEFGEDYTFTKNNGDKITGYVTDDGYLNFMLRDGLINSKRLIYKKKLFEPSGVLPYRFIITSDVDLLVYDYNYKLLGSIRNKENFKNVDFAWPDQKDFWDKTGVFHFKVENHNIRIIDSEKRNAGIDNCYTNIYFDKPVDKTYDNYGYLIVDKNGDLKHVNYVNNKVDKEWDTKDAVKGNGPYSLDVFNLGLVLLNGDGEVYWTTHPSVSQTNEEYQAMLKKLNN